MYKNYGDVNFFEYGILIDDNHTDSEYDMLRCTPYSDEEDLYTFKPLHVDINDTWIDFEDVLDFSGMEEFDPIEFAIACTDYYSWDNFGTDYGAEYDWQRFSREEILAELKNYDISFEILKKLKGVR